MYDKASGRTIKFILPSDKDMFITVNLFPEEHKINLFINTMDVNSYCVANLLALCVSREKMMEDALYLLREMPKTQVSSPFWGQAPGSEKPKMYASALEQIAEFSHYLITSLATQTE